jgi:toxin ParE1/3/4
MATQDLLDIWDFVAGESWLPIADKQLKEIEGVCYRLGGWPEYGRARDDVRTGLRSVLVSRYVVFYRVTKTAIEIVRILDERRDVDTVFADEP